MRQFLTGVAVFLLGFLANQLAAIYDIAFGLTGGAIATAIGYGLLITSAPARRIWRWSISNGWRRQLSVIVLTGIVTGTLGSLVAWALITQARQVHVRDSDKQVTTNATASPAMFHEKSEAVTFSIGGMSSRQTFERLKTPPPYRLAGFGIPGGGEYAPVTLRADKNNNLLFHFKVWGGAGAPPIEVIDNEFVVRPEGHDRNYNADALEVIDGAGMPIFQMIRQSPTNIMVNGIFPLPNGTLLIASGRRALINDQIPPDMVLKPLFKYPSWRYKGLLRDEEPVDRAAEAKSERHELREGLKRLQAEGNRLRKTFRMLIRSAADEQSRAVQSPDPAKVKQQMTEILQWEFAVLRYVGMHLGSSYSKRFMTRLPVKDYPDAVGDVRAIHHSWGILTSDLAWIDEFLNELPEL